MPIPVLQAIVLADRIYSDTSSGKKVIAGTFNVIRANEVPYRYIGGSWAYMALTGVHGQAEIHLRQVDLDDNSIVGYSTPLLVKALSPIVTAEVCLELPPFSFPKHGAYSLELLCEGQILGAVRIHFESPPELNP